MRKAGIALTVFVLVSATVFGAAAAVSGDIALPRPITESSACPATGCASGSCHGFDDVPEPDGVHEMACPEMTCASAECHAWDTLMGGYRQASDASLTLWIVVPVVVTLALTLIIKRL